MMMSGFSVGGPGGGANSGVKAPAGILTNHALQEALLLALQSCSKPLSLQQNLLEQ